MKQIHPQNALGGQPSSTWQHNHEARQESGGLLTHRLRLVRQDQQTYESRLIIKADAKEIVPWGDTKRNPLPFVSFKGGVRAVTCRPRRTPRAKQHTSLAQSSLDSVNSLPPLPTRYEESRYRQPPCQPSKPTYQRVAMITPDR